MRVVGGRPHPAFDGTAGRRSDEAAVGAADERRLEGCRETVGRRQVSAVARALADEQQRLVDATIHLDDVLFDARHDEAEHRAAVRRRHVLADAELPGRRLCSAGLALVELTYDALFFCNDLHLSDLSRNEENTQILNSRALKLRNY